MMLPLKKGFCQGHSISPSILPVLKFYKMYLDKTTNGVNKIKIAVHVRINNIKTYITLDIVVVMYKK